MSEKKKSAFTLIEMIIVISLTLIVIAITSSIFITGNRVFSDSDVNTTLQMEGQRIQEEISDIGMQGISIKNIANGIEFKSYNQEGTKKIYDIIFSAPELKVEEYDIDENDDKKEIDKTNIISTNVKSFNVEEKDNCVNFNVELFKNKSFKKEIYPVNFKVTLRNKGK